MNNDLLVSIKKHTHALTEQTKTNPQETLEFKMNKQMETFSINRPIILNENSKWLLAKTSFEATNSVFNLTDENNTFSITAPGHWNSKFAEKVFFHERNKLLEFRSQNDIDLDVEQFRKKVHF